MNAASLFRAAVASSTLLALLALSPPESTLAQAIEKAAEKEKPKEADKPKELRPGELKLSTERVIIFKDGYCLFIKKGIAKADAQGEVFTEQVPDAAVLGSFWATPKEGRLVNMNAGTVTTHDKATKPVPCTQHIEILQANKGKVCTVELEGNQTMTGTIRDVLTQETSEVPTPGVLSALPDIDADLLLAHGALPRGRSSFVRPTAAPTSDRITMAGVTGSLFVLEANDGDVVIPIAQIRRLTIKGLKLTNDRVFTTTRVAKRLTFRFEKPGDQELSILYFVPGIRWIPTYRAQLAQEEKPTSVQLSLQAELLNECEDLIDVPVDLVVGVPNFRFKGTISPFSLEATIRNALAEAAPQLMGQQQMVSNALFTQRSGEHVRNVALANDAGDAPVPNLPPELSMSGSQDLFIYKLPKITLAKGHRSAVPIFTSPAPVSALYTWDLRLKRQDTHLAATGGAPTSPLALSTNQIWHQLEMVNKTKMPWTTGPVLMMQGQQPLAQELLTYTSPGSTVRVPVTVSVDTRGNYTEKETNRTLKALQWNNTSYARIDKEGTLSVTNNKSVPVEIEVTCHLGGNVGEVSNDGTVTLGAFDPNDWVNYHGHPALNNHSTVVWRLKLKPGETISPTVKYHFFTPY